MKKNKLATGVSVILLIVLFTQLLLQSSCANIIPPTGGPRDSLPPVIVSMTPKDSTKNFKDNRITVAFDEYIDLQDIQKQLVVSPIPKTTPAVEKRLSSILIRLKDTLEPNTTYTLNFGNAIRDLNESNVLKNFTYMFTTGDYFDSLTLRGNVIMAQDASIDTTLKVMLHTNMTDSAIVKEKPRYVAKVDRNGNFIFRNLPKDTFAIYAIEDESNTYRFSGRDQLFAFADKTYMSGDTSKITLYAFPDNEGASTGGPVRRAQPSKEKRLIIRTNLSGNQQDLLSKFEMEFETPLKTFDTTKVVFATDSTFTPVTEYSFIQDSTKKKVTLQYTWKENTAYHVILDKDFASDTLGNKLLKSDTISFNTKKNTDYGAVRLRLRNVDMTKNPVLLFVQSNKVVDSAILAGPEYRNQMLRPGDYELRILYDNNKNGTWDPGVFFGKEKKQPELVKPFAQSITIKPNWDNDFERDLNAAAPPSRNDRQSPGQPASQPGQRRPTTGPNNPPQY